MRRFSLGFLAAAAMLIAVPSGASAATTIGQTGTSPANCDPGDWAQPTVTSGNSYVVPATGGITDWALTSWSHLAKAAAGQKLKVKVFRPVAGLTYTVVGQDVSRDLPTAGGLTTFSTNIAVKAGDVLGMTVPAGEPGCAFVASGETFYYTPGDAPTGASVTFESFPDLRLNISAVLEPDCDRDGFGDETRDANLDLCRLTCKGQRLTKVGTNGPDDIVGTANRDVIAALAGNDEVSGLEGNDLICGNEGRDKLRGGRGKDKLLGQKGKDRLKGQKGKDRLRGGKGRDVCKGGKGSDAASKCEVEKSV